MSNTGDILTQIWFFQLLNFHDYVKSSTVFATASLLTN